MKRHHLITALCGAALLFASAAVPAQTREPSAAQKRQQERMRECSKDASGMKGDARRNFMSQCLKGSASAGATRLTPQQQRMKDCNRTAGERKLKGEARRKFMSSCLKG